MGMLCSVPEKAGDTKTAEIVTTTQGAATTTTGQTQIDENHSRTVEAVGTSTQNYTMSGVFSPITETFPPNFETITNQNLEKLTKSTKLEYSRESNSEVEIILVPHVHTLFCERKQRVCGSVGKIQELEILKLDGNVEDIVDESIVWMRSLDDVTNYFVNISNGGKLMEYQLTLEDVGCFVSARFVSVKSGLTVVTKAMGPVLPGPPRYTKVGVGGKLWAGGYAIAETSYIGGFEGASEYWWLRIRDGVREQVRDQLSSDPLSLVNTDSQVVDPRVYHLTTGKHY